MLTFSAKIISTTLVTPHPPTQLAQSNTTRPQAPLGQHSMNSIQQTLVLQTHRSLVNHVVVSSATELGSSQSLSVHSHAWRHLYTRGSNYLQSRRSSQQQMPPTIWDKKQI